MATDPMWYQATGEMIVEGVMQGASDLTNPDWQSWRAEQIQNGFAYTEDDFTNENWWEWKGDQVETGATDPRPPDLAETSVVAAAPEAAPAAAPPAEAAAAPAAAPPAEAAPAAASAAAAERAEAQTAAAVATGAAAVGAAGLVAENTQQSQRGKAENEAQEIDPTAEAQSGGGFFSKKQLNISDEIADKQVDVMMQILEVYEVYARQMKETDEKYQCICKSNKPQKQGKQKEGYIKMVNGRSDRSF